MVHDTRGHVIMAFFNYYDTMTNKEVEIHAIWDLINIYRKKGIVLSTLVSDSLNVVNMIQEKSTMS